MSWLQVLWASCHVEPLTTFWVDLSVYLVDVFYLQKVDGKQSVFILLYIVFQSPMQSPEAYQTEAKDLIYSTDVSQRSWETKNDASRLNKFYHSLKKRTATNIEYRNHARNNIQRNM